MQAELSYDNTILSYVDFTSTDDKTSVNASDGVGRVAILRSYATVDLDGDYTIATLEFQSKTDPGSGSHVASIALDSALVSLSGQGSADSNPAQCGAAVQVNVYNLTITFIDIDTYHGVPTGYQVMLMKLNGDEVSDANYKYDGNMMYWSSKYGAYVYIVTDDVDKATALANISIQVPKTGEDALAYDGDVNRNNVVNINDAQIAYDLYSGHINYLTDFNFELISIVERLEADVNGDGAVDTQDVRWIHNKILTQMGL